jgi:deoxyribonuclease V
MEIAALHRWPREPRRAIALQRRLAGQVRLVAAPRRPRLFAGADVAFSPDGTRVIAGVVLWDAQTDAVIESHVARRPCTFPYVPGLLSFREIPAALVAFRRLRQPPDVVLCDGQGYAHPRRIGLASHLGLWLDVPTVGCAKSRLCGTHDEPGPGRGDHAPLWDRDDQIGCVVRTRDGVKPLYVSPGHLCDRSGAVRLTLAAGRGYRLPEPTRRAHQLVTAARTRVR